MSQNDEKLNSHRVSDNSIELINLNETDLTYEKQEFADNINSVSALAGPPGSSGGSSQQLQSQQNAQQSAQQSQTAVPQTQSVSQQRQQDSNQQNSVQQSPTNSSALSNNAVNAANNTGSLKPKTMVATPEQVSPFSFFVACID